MDQRRLLPDENGRSVFDADFGVNEWHGTNAFIRDGEKVFRTYLINSRDGHGPVAAWMRSPSEWRVRSG
jgi:predicted dithiol-disulfide oxidoreductase (DUF899 family)